MSDIHSPDKVVGFYNEAQTILDHLIRGPKEKDVVSVTGMGGLGKTSLARRVYREERVVKHFDLRAWCTISQEYDCNDLLKKIYDQVCDKPKENVDGIAPELRKSLMGNRYLIVLDDVWSLEAWEELNRVFPSCDNGSRIIITSRQENVVSDAKHICLPFFTVDESWELLQMKLFEREECPEELETIGIEISKKCGGLPLVVGLVAGLLKGVEKKEQSWHEFLNSLNSLSAFRNEFQTNEVIELSYKHLPDHLKPCLVYFAAFAEDKEIEASHLIGLWNAEGFVVTLEKERIEDDAEDYLNNLAGYNLIMVSEREYNSRILRCTVHDLVRDFCLRKAKEENLFQIIKLKKVLNPTFNDRRRLWGREFYICSDIHEEEKVLSPRNCSAHTLLVSPIGVQLGSSRPSIYNMDLIITNLFERLTVLDLEDASVVEEEVIRPKLESLVHLRYLALNIDGGKRFLSSSSLQNLECLITLKLRTTRSHLPKFFWNMTSLRHMLINHISCEFCEKEPLSVIEAIPNSEILQSLHSSLSIGDENLLRKLPHLKSLSCMVPRSYQFVEIDFLHHLQYLQLHGKRGFWDDHCLSSKFPSSIKEVRLLHFFLSSSGISTLAQLPNLEALTLYSCEFEGKEWNVDEETQYSKLKCLKLDRVDLRRWNIDVAYSFPCLEKLNVLSCWDLVKLPTSLADILSLKEVVVKCKLSVRNSIEEILKDAQDMGNEQLKVIMI